MFRLALILVVALTAGTAAAGEFQPRQPKPATAPTSPPVATPAKPVAKPVAKPRAKQAPRRAATVQPKKKKTVADRVEKRPLP